MKRVDLADQFLSNQTNQQTIDNIIKLRNSIEEKRKLLDKIYLEAAGGDENSENKPNEFGATMLKKVQFESLDVTEEPRVDKIFNSTFTIKKITQQNEKTSSKSKINEKNKEKCLPGQKEKKDLPKTNKSPKTVSKPVQRQVLTYHQKKLIEKEKKNKFEASLKEIRDKILMRKFAYIWLRKHLNKNKFLTKQKCILPSEASNYYKNKTMKKNLIKWHEEVKFERNEWRLNVKAECHHNYVLYNKMWSQWKEFLVENIYEKNMLKKATGHYNQIVKKKLFSSWVQFHKYSVRARINLSLVEEKRNIEIKKEIFSIWYNKFRINLRYGNFAEIAERHHQLVILSKCYSVWLFKFTFEKEDRRKMKKAENYYRQNVLRKYLTSVKMYTLYRRKKRIQKQKLNEYAESQLVYKTFQTWYQKYQFILRINILEDEINSFSQTYLKYRVLKYMQQEYNNRIILRIKEAKAVKFHNKKLKLKAFDSIKQNLTEAKNEIFIVQKADKFDSFWCKKLVFYKWLDRMDDKNEIKSMHLVFKAKKHYDSYLMRTGFITWKYFVKQKKKQDAKEKKAIDFNNSKLVKLYFEYIKTYVVDTQRKRENHRLAEEFYKINAYGKYFEKWYQIYEKTIEYQMNKRIAILHYESSVHAKFFSFWSQKYHLKLREELNENRAEFWNRKHLLKKYLTIWIQLNLEKKLEFINEKKALVHDFKRTCTPAFDLWKQFIDQKKCYYSKCNLADNFYKVNLEKKVIKIWKLRKIDFKRTNQIIDLKYNQKQQEKLKKLFNLWRDDVNERKIEKRNEEIAITFYLKHLMVKIIYEWRDYCVHKALRRFQDQELIEKFEDFKSKLIKGHIFILWKEKCYQVISEERKEQIAINFYNRKSKEKYMIAWKVYNKFCLRKRLLNNQAKWFLEMRLKSDAFYKWTIKYDHECAIRDKNEKALLLWSINIQKNCLFAWQNWIQHKKQKQERYKNALEMRQSDIIKECSRKFLKFSMDSKIRRLQASRILKEKYLLNSVELQSKYFNIWLNKCKFKSLPKKEEKKIFKIKNSLSQVKCKKSAILEDISLDKKESISGPTTSFKNLDSTKTRPAPRKPAFIESIDCSREGLESEKIVETVEINNELIEDQQLNIPKEVIVNPVLLPPSAFVSPKLVSPNEPAYAEKEINSNDLKSSSLSTICNTEVFKEINFEKSMTNLVKSNSSSTTTLNSETKKLSNKDNDLIGLKKRLEEWALKSDKLKRLKEQEKLLLNCIKSNEINQTSMCETIYKEKEQVQEEIREISRYIKREKPIVNELLKKYKLS